MISINAEAPFSLISRRRQVKNQGERVQPTHPEVNAKSPRREDAKVIFAGQ
jgi:hypothetical protein